jgi:arabinofuranan 3-O-arabinosyltransferase
VTAQARPWPFAGLVAVISGLALTAALPHARGWYVIDNQSVFFWAPWRVTEGLLHAWDPRLDLGGPSPGYAPGIYLVMSALRGLGVEPWLAQRLFHAALLALGGAGVAAVARFFLPRVGIAHLTAALVYMFGPFSVTFLLPSWLYMNYALAPWWLLALLRGVTGAGRWRWAAVFALALVGSGAMNPPGTVLAMVPLVPAAAYLVHVERRCRWRDVLTWSAMAGGLSALVLAPLVLRFVDGADQVVANLSQSEGVEAVSRSSSWAESWRGLGSWLSYWGVNGPAIRQSSRFLTSPILALVSFVPACVAVAVIWRSRWRPRLLLAAMMVLALMLMVGAYPLWNPSPLGRLLVESYDRSILLFSFRNSYKAGPGLMIGLAVLCGVASAEAARWVLRRRPGARQLATGVVLLVVGLFVAVSAGPFWAGSIYTDGQRVPAVPDHYVEAVRWLDSQPGEGRVLILPLAAQDRYRWAESPHFDLFQPLLGRPHLRREILSPSGGLTTNLLDELAEWMASGEARSPLPSILSRLGVEFLLVRNDLQWEQVAAPRPATVREQLEGASLERVAAFGEPGEHVVDDATASSVPSEAALAPVEIYRVAGVDGTARVVPLVSSLLVSGDGGAWPTLAEQGWLEEVGPLRYTGELEADDLARELSSGAGIFVTDTNRRRAGGFGPGSYTLPSSREPQGVQDLFGRSGSQSVAVYGHARDITDLSPSTLFPGGRSHRPAAAFDGDPTTAWLTGRMDPDPRYGLRIDLDRPMTVSSAQLTAALPLGGTRRVERATLHFSDGDPATVDLVDPHASVTFPPRETEWIEVRIDAIVGFGTTAVGFSEIELPGLDLREFIRVPDDVFELGVGEGTHLEGLLGTAPVSYQLRRLRGGEVHEEQALRREVRVLGQRRLAVRGELALGPTISDDVLPTLVDTPVRAHGSNRWPRDLSGSGLFAVDGRLDTGWSSVPESGSRLSVTFPEQPVSQVEVAVEVGDEVTDIVELVVSAGDGDPVPLRMSDASPCPEADDEALSSRCVLAGVEVPPTVAGSIEIELTELAPLPEMGGAKPARILDVRIEGVDRVPLPENLAGRCVTPGVLVGGRSLPVRVSGAVDDIVAGRGAPFEGCEPIVLEDGWHRVHAALGVVLDSVELSTHPRSAFGTGAEQLPAVLRDRGRSHLRLEVDAPAGARLVSGQAFSPGWRASVDGEPLGRADSLDLMAGWTLPARSDGDGGPRVVDVELSGAGRYRSAVAVSVVATMACLALALVNPGRRRPVQGAAIPGGGLDGSVRPTHVLEPVRPRQARRHRRIARRRARVASGTLAVLAALLIAGPVGATVGFASVAVAIRRPTVARHLSLGALVLLLLAALSTVPPLGPPMVITPDFGSLREMAHALGRMSAVLLVAALAAFTVDERDEGDTDTTVREDGALPVSGGEVGDMAQHGDHETDEVDQPDPSRL